MSLYFSATSRGGIGPRQQASTVNPAEEGGGRHQKKNEASKISSPEEVCCLVAPSTFAESAPNRLAEKQRRPDSRCLWKLENL